MKFLSSVILGSASLFAATDLVNVSCPEVIQGGAVAILGVAVWYLLAKEIPSLIKLMKEEREANNEMQATSRKDFIEFQRESQKRYEQSLKGISNSMDKLSDALHMKVLQEIHVEKTDPDER